ncbi:hypothetical protein ABZ835_42820 [Streptomyces sp. NPDC047461]|uniref:hypothetical protein n=1 Tax=Streptomyces sp. NPDC047461 TaxID=3155619 RepID=UPI0033D57B7C
MDNAPVPPNVPAGCPRWSRKAVLDHSPELASSFEETPTTLSGTRLPEWVAKAGIVDPDAQVLAYGRVDARPARVVL